MKTRAELQTMPGALDRRIPDMLREAEGDEGEFWCIFVGEADDLDENAGGADCQWVHEQMRAMFDAHGIVWQPDAAC